MYVIYIRICILYMCKNTGFMIHTYILYTYVYIYTHIYTFMYIYILRRDEGDEVV